MNANEAASGTAWRSLAAFRSAIINVGKVAVRQTLKREVRSGPTAPSALLATLFFGCTLVLGGGGSPAPLPEIILECLAALTLGLWSQHILGSPKLSEVPRSAWIIAGIVLAVPLVQLVPLPPLLWQSLPGREVERAALALIGEQSSWRPWSLAPSRTLTALLAFAPPLLLLVMTSVLAWPRRVTLIRTLLLVALATLILGALQHSAGEDSPLHFYGVTGPVLTGFQANGNGTADLLLISIMTVPLLLRDLANRRIIPDRPLLTLIIGAASMAVLAFAVILTSSRMGILLLPVPILASFWIMRRWIHLSRRTVAVAAIVMLALVALGATLAATNPVLAAVVGRFDFTHELRPEMWRNGGFLVQKYFPFGAGMGDFVPAFITDEPLEAVGNTILNRAHNDFIELALETGIFGLLALSAVSVLLGREVWRNRPKFDETAANLTCFASTALAVFALHSAVDYPFRAMTLACLGGVCVGLLIAPRAMLARSQENLGIPDPITQQSSGPALVRLGTFMKSTEGQAAPRLALRIAVAVLCVGYAAMALGNGLDRLSAGRRDRANAVPALFASEALRVAGAQALADGKPAMAVLIGKRAINDAPADPQSSALLAAGLLGSGARREADQAFRVAGQLGWRVPVTQSYWLSRALAVSDYQTAGLRLDALLRQQPGLLSQRQLTDPFERNPAGRAALVQRLALRPEWLPSYVGDIAAVSGDALLQRGVVLEEAAHSGVILGCEMIAPMTRRLIELKFVEDAARLWAAQCPSRDRELIKDPPL